MFGKLKELFRGKPALIKGAGKLQEGESRKIALGDILAGGKEVVLCRVEGKLHAVDTRCPHEDGYIVAGPLIDGRYVLCPLHNYQFDPTSGAPRNAVCGKAQTYKVREVDGDAEVWI